MIDRPLTGRRPSSATRRCPPEPNARRRRDRACKDFPYRFRRADLQCGAPCCAGVPQCLDSQDV